MVSIVEQETTVAAGRDEAVVYIYSTVPKHLRRLRADKRVTERDGGEDWGSFTIPSDQFDPLRGFKRQRAPLTAEQREAAGDRLRLARAARG